MSGKLLIVAGPTASGKTAVAIELARTLGGEIISADARQVFRHLDIGTAKPTAEECAAAPHHLIDYVDPTERYDAARFVRDATEAIEEIRGRGLLPIIAGGTGLYIRTLIHGLDVTAGRDEEFREELRARIEREGSDAIHAELASIDPESAAAIHPNDSYRMIRALEIHALTGKTRSEQFANSAAPVHDAFFAALDHPREALYRRIDRRFDSMMESGFLEEVRNLLDRGLDPGLTCFRAPGYREMIAHLVENKSLADSIDLAKRETRRLAKRQFTWFRNTELRWFDGGGDCSDCAGTIASEFASTSFD